MSDVCAGGINFGREKIKNAVSEISYKTQNFKSVGAIRVKNVAAHDNAGDGQDRDRQEINDRFDPALQQRMPQSRNEPAQHRGRDCQKRVSALRGYCGGLNFRFDQFSVSSYFSSALA